MTKLLATAQCPVTKRDLKAYFAVYSPKVFDDVVHDRMKELIQSSPHILVTIEHGENGNHKHANYFWYSMHRDAFNLRRVYKLPKGPEWKVKAVTSPNNVITYMTKEGT